MKGANNEDLRACALGIPRREGQTVAFLLGGVMFNRFFFFFFFLFCWRLAAQGESPGSLRFVIKVCYG